MQQEENYRTLYVPMNIKTRFEFVDGFGFSELFTTLIISAIVGIFVFIMNMFSDNPYNAVLIVSVAAVAIGMAVRKNDINLSITDMIKLFWNFYHTQQKYFYSYYDRFSGGV